MDHTRCDHSNCAGSASTNASVMQTLSEMDWERGIWYAAFNGDLNKVQSLIDQARQAKEVVTAPDNSGYTALHYAARNGYVDICKLLLQHGADIDAQTKSAATPLHKAAASGKISTVNFLLRNGARLDAQDVDGETVLHKAIQNKHLNLIETFLQACPKLRDIADSKGRLPDIVRG